MLWFGYCTTRPYFITDYLLALLFVLPSHIRSVCLVLGALLSPLVNILQGTHIATTLKLTDRLQHLAISSLSATVADPVHAF